MDSVTTSHTRHRNQRAGNANASQEVLVVGELLPMVEAANRRPVGSIRTKSCITHAVPRSGLGSRPAGLHKRDGMKCSVQVRVQADGRIANHATFPREVASC